MFEYSKIKDPFRYNFGKFHEYIKLPSPVIDHNREVNLSEAYLTKQLKNKILERLIYYTSYILYF